MFGFAAAMLFPPLTSTIGGIGHPLRCKVSTGQGFTITRVTGAPPTIASSVLLTRRQVSCNQLSFELGVETEDRGDKATLVLPIRNRTSRTYAATVLLRIDGRLVPIGMGKIKGQSTKIRRVTVKLREDPTRVSAVLAIGA